jgi:hypothetical protein
MLFLPWLVKSGEGGLKMVIFVFAFTTGKQGDEKASCTGCDSDR